MDTLNITKEHIEECIKTNHKEMFDDGWDVFRVYNGEPFYGVKLCKPYSEGEIDFNEDGYKYKTVFVEVNNTRDYLFFLDKGYDVRSLF